MVKAQPVVTVPEGHMLHPLYRQYASCFDFLLSKESYFFQYSNMDGERHAWEFLNMHMGLINEDYIGKMCGYLSENDKRFKSPQART